MGKLSGSHFKCQLNDLDIIEDSSFDATVHDSKKSPFFSHAHYVLARSGHHKIGCSLPPRKAALFPPPTIQHGKISQ